MRARGGLLLFRASVSLGDRTGIRLGSAAASADLGHRERADADNTEKEEAAGLAFDVPLLADSLALGADGLLRFGGSTGKSKGGIPEHSSSHATDAPHFSSRPTWDRPDRRAVSMALQPPIVIPPPLPMVEMTLRLPHPAPHARGELVSESDACQAEMHNTLAAEPRLRGVFDAAFDEEMRHLAAERRHDVDSAVTPTDAAIASGILAERLAGQWESQHKGGGLRVHNVEVSGNDEWTVRSSDMSGGGADGRTPPRSSSFRLHSGSDGRVLWSRRGDVWLELAAVKPTSLTWHHRDGHSWEWLRRGPAPQTLVKAIDNDTMELQPEQPKVIGHGTQTQVDKTDARSSLSSSTRQELLAASSQMTFGQDSRNSRDRTKVLSALSRYVIDTFRRARMSGENSEEGECVAALNAARQHARGGDPVAVAAELSALEKAWPAGDDPVTAAAQAVEELHSKYYFDSDARRFIFSCQPSVQIRVAGQFAKWLRSKDKPSKNDYSRLLVSFVWTCKAEWSNARKLALLARKIERAAAPNKQERQLREDIVLMLVSDGQALEWPRLRELLLAKSDVAKADKKA